MRLLRVFSVMFNNFSPHNISIWVGMKLFLIVGMQNHPLKNLWERITLVIIINYKNILEIDKDNILNLVERECIGGIVMQ